jgi:DNA-binding phage protein
MQTKQPTQAEGNPRRALLRDPEGIAEYLDAAMSLSIEDGDIVALLDAIRRVAVANNGLDSLAAKAGISRVDLDQVFAEHKNPNIPAVVALLKAYGLRLGISQITENDAGFARSAVAEPENVASLR